MRAFQNDNDIDSPLMNTLVSVLLSGDNGDSNDSNQGVSSLFLDTLDRVPKSKLKPDDACPICQNVYLEDNYPLVVRLRCRHMFDLECLGPWLKLNNSCPMCRSEAERYEHYHPLTKLFLFSLFEDTNQSLTKNKA